MQVPFLGDWAKGRAERGALEILGAADTLAFGGVGIAGAVLPETRAFVMLSASERLAAYEPELRRLVRDGSPAGRIFAARLLARLHPHDTATWAHLFQDTAVVMTAAGCIFEQKTVQESAADLLRAHHG